MAERIRISLSGRIGVEVGDEVVDGAALGPLGGLALAFLVTERRRPVTRDELAEVLWGEDLPTSWEASLRAVVPRVRRRLEAAGLVDDVIAGGGGCYQLHLPEGAVVDVEEAAADLEAARDAVAHGDWGPPQKRAGAAADAAGHRFLPGLGGLWVERRQPLREYAHLRVMAAHAGRQPGRGAAGLRAVPGGACRGARRVALGAHPGTYEAVLAGGTNTPGHEPRGEGLRPEGPRHALPRSGQAAAALSSRAHRCRHGPRGASGDLQRAAVPAGAADAITTGTPAALDRTPDPSVRLAAVALNVPRPVERRGTPGR